MRVEASVAWLIAAVLVTVAPPSRASSPSAPPFEPPSHAASTSTEPASVVPSQVVGHAASPHPPLAPPNASVLLEAPYKMGERLTPRSKQAYRDEIRELRHWGAGGTGELVEPLPGPEGHPDPRVIINVERVKGPHRPQDLQRLARRNHWIQVIRCYRLGAYKDPMLRGWSKAVIGVSKSGAVRGTRLIETQLADREVADCIVSKLSDLKFPKARSGSNAWLEVRVSPGDEPMPPPESLLVPGEGTLEPVAMRAGVEAGLPAFEECYRAGLRYAPGLWGRILLRFHVTERGTVDEVFQSGTSFPDARVAQCVVRSARQLRFPKPVGGDLRFVAGLRLSSDRSRHELVVRPDTESGRAPRAVTTPARQKQNGQD